MIPTPSHPAVGTPYGRPGTMWAAGHHTVSDPESYDPAAP